MKKIWLLALIYALGFVSAGAADTPDKYRIGALLAMTGPSSFYGQVMSQGIKQAVDEINEAGGIDGIPLEVTIEDHKGGGGQEAVTGMNRLLLSDVQAVLTSFSGPTIAIAPLADQHHILLMNGGAVSAKLVGLSPYLFHNRSLATDLSRIALTYAKESGAKKLAELQWQNDVGDSIAHTAEPLWKSFGGEVVATEAVPQGAINMDTSVAKLRAANPDLVALWMFTPEVGLALKRLRDFGMTQPVIGVEFTENDAKIAGKAADGYHFATDYFQASPDNPWSQRFAELYQKRYGTAPDFYAANYYEGVYVIAALIRRTHRWNGDALREALLQNPHFDSIYGGQMTFGANGVAQKRTALFTVENGQRKFVQFLDATPEK
ncbi:MAG TPA: ABC transporter substrate-binding protein [Stellaceae bacterium]|nr:ABC transporter substrate-binding protein [Stellaceae bacterium]